MSRYTSPELQETLASAPDQDVNKGLLRFTTAGSVDDGKSTLIGRLLHDSQAIYEDQLASVKNSRINHSSGPFDFALLTDGLRAEREQGITIDVAYRYFATPRRKFIIADTPGHEEYTRNMVTGASTADLAIILIDATKGLLPQTRRHAYIAALLGIQTVVGAVNKMDLVGYREEVFCCIERDFAALIGRLGIPNFLVLPLSALEGDNVVNRSKQMPWYQGPTLIEHLETVPIRLVSGVDALRFPVQCVIRPDTSFRGFAGQIASGVVRSGDTVIALPSKRKTRIRSIVTYDGELDEATAPMPVTLLTEDEIDLSRGDMLVSPLSQPSASRHFEAMVVWFHPEPLELRRSYLLKHSTRTVRAQAAAIHYRVDVNTLAQEPARRLEMNEIASVEFESVAPIFFDSYDLNRTLGSFILIDPLSNATVGAAMIRRDLSGKSSEFALGSLNSGIREVPVSLPERYARHGHQPAIVLVESRPKLAALLETELFQRGFEVLLITDNQVAMEDLPLIVRIAMQTGMVVIYASASGVPVVKVQFRELAGDALLDLAEIDLAVNDMEAAERVLLRMELLRIRNDEPELEKEG